MNNENSVEIIPNNVLNVKTKIKKFETNYNLMFPQEYKEFFTRYNGGKTNKAKFKKEGWQSDFYGDSISIEEFYSIEKIYVAYQEK